MLDLNNKLRMKPGWVWSKRSWGAEESAVLSRQSGIINSTQLLGPWEDQSHPNHVPAQITTSCHWGLSCLVSSLPKTQIPMSPECYTLLLPFLTVPTHPSAFLARSTLRAPCQGWPAHLHHEVSMRRLRILNWTAAGCRPHLATVGPRSLTLPQNPFLKVLLKFLWSWNGLYRAWHIESTKGKQSSLMARAGRFYLHTTGFARQNKTGYTNLQGSGPARRLPWAHMSPATRKGDWEVPPWVPAPLPLFSDPDKKKTQLPFLQVTSFPSPLPS